MVRKVKEHVLIYTHYDKTDEIGEVSPTPVGIRQHVVPLMTQK